MKQFYVLALSAFKFEGGAALKEIRTRDVMELSGRTAAGLPMTVRLSAHAAMADSEEEATDIGLRLAREKWEASDGWSGHSASAALVERDVLASALRRVDEDSDAENGLVM